MSDTPQNRDESGDPNRNPDGTWKEGNRANPGGRPKMPAKLRAAFQEYSFEALETLVECMRDKGAQWKDRVKAADTILDRGVGRAPQALEVSGPDGGPIPQERPSEPDPKHVAAVARVLHAAGVSLADEDDGDE